MENKNTSSPTLALNLKYNSFYMNDEIYLVVYIKEI